MSDYCMLKRIGSIIAAVAILLALYGLVSVGMTRYVDREQALDSALEGVIVHKKIVNAHSGIFTSTPMSYALIVQVQYSVNGEERSGNKTVHVDKETYTKADIGKWFNIGTLEVTDIPSTSASN